ncbi:MAG TPA: hypothetical protein VFU62_00695 [Hanamia sp.]|nr:hypothetical protein [Hanamia sp.]
MDKSKFCILINFYSIKNLIPSLFVFSFNTGVAKPVVYINSSHPTDSVYKSSLDNLPVDKSASKQTKSLYFNLKKLLHKGIMFGHQDDCLWG